MENTYLRKLPLTLTCIYTGIMGFSAFMDSKGRKRLGPRERLSQWASMYRATLIPMSLLNIGISISGILEYYDTKNSNWAMGAGLMTGIISYTLFIIRPVITKVLQADTKGDTSESDQNIKKWIGLHRFKLLLAAVSAALFLYAQVQQNIGQVTLKL